MPKPKQLLPGEKPKHKNSDIENIMHSSPQKNEYDKLEMNHAMYYDEI